MKYFYQPLLWKNAFSWCNRPGGKQANREKLKSEWKQLGSEGFAKYVGAKPSPKCLI